MTKQTVSNSPMHSHNFNVQTQTGCVDRTTPGWLLSEIRDIFGGYIGLDPCPHPQDLVHADQQYMISNKARDLMASLSVARKEKSDDKAKQKEIKAYVKSLKNALDTELNDPGCPNGLLLPWRSSTGGLKVFANIPYGKQETPLWCKKHVQEFPLRPSNGDACILLLPAEVGSQWFQDILLPNIDALCILRGRLAFGPELSNTAPFWSMLTLAGDQKAITNFGDVLRPYGWVTELVREDG